MYTALTLRSGSCTPNLSPHLQQAEGQEEEELLQPGEGGARRQGEKEKKAALASRSRLLSHVDLFTTSCTIMEINITYLAFILLTPYPSICPQ